MLEICETDVPKSIVTNDGENGVIPEIKTANTTATIASNGHGVHLTEKNLKLHFCNVTYTSKQNNSKLQKILNDICGEFKSGRLTAILGPSGAGKTSMLNVLSGFKAHGVTGQFTLNEEERNLLAFRKMSCYIPQDFALLDLLTVHETIKDSADLKLDAKTSAEEKQKIIDDILKILNMYKCRHTLVRNLSGGERKRLSIGIELVTNPPVMFFDEPTSGLDSVASFQVMSYLCRLARDGRIIVCVVHQPSSRLIKLFDDILVMSHGEVLYAGAQQAMLSYFEQSGFSCPNYYNPADFVLEVGSMEHNENIVELVQRNKDRYCSGLGHSSRLLDDATDEKKNSNIACTEYNKNAEMLAKESTCIAITMNEIATAKDLQRRQSQCAIILRPKTQVSVCRQFSVLIRRSLRSMSRNLIAVQLRLVMHIVVAVLLGIVFWGIGNDGSKVLSNSSCIFFMVLFIFFGNAMPSILLCPQDTAVFVREYLNGWYSITAYFISKVISDLPMQFACPTFFVTIVYFMTGQPDDMARFAMCWGITMLTAAIGHFIGLAFGSTFDIQMAVFLVPGVTIPFMIFSGFFIRIHELASFLRPVCDVSFFRYTMEGYMQALYGYDRAQLKCNIDFCYFKSPQKFLKELGMWGDLYGRDLLVLLLWIVVCAVLFFLSLVLRIRKAQR